MTVVAVRSAPPPVPPPASLTAVTACPAANAWGQDPSQAGILVTVWSAQPDAVTVLVRTARGVDHSRRATFRDQDHVRLLPFPEIDYRSVRSVLVLTDSRQCVVRADPAAMP